MKHPAQATPVDSHERPIHDSAQIEAQRWLSGMMADLADSVNGLTLRGARAVPIGTAPSGTLRPLSGGAAGRLVGWSLRESSGTAGVLVRIFDGRDANATLLATIPLAQASETVSDNSNDTSALPQGGISITDGLYISVTDPLTLGVTTGTVEGSLWIGAAE